MDSRQIEAKLRSLSRRLCCLAKNGIGGGGDILYSEGSLSGPAGDYVFGIDYSTGDIYYKDVDGNWAILAIGGAVEITPLVTDIAAYNGTAEYIIVEDETRGGQFSRYYGSQATDNGVIFLDAGGVKWKRDCGNHINAKWYPIIENTNMSAIWTQIYTAAKNKENIPQPKIYFPANTATNKYYQFFSTINIDTKTEIFGDGTNTWLRWNGSVSGITTDFITSRYSKLKDLLIDGASSSIPSGSPLGSNWSTAVKGLAPKDIIEVENVTFRYWAGDAVYLHGDANNGSNVNNCLFYNVTTVQNRRHGFRISGPDANAILFFKCEGVSNGGEGIYDTSFLGNNYYGFHSASNGSPEIAWQRGLVSYGGQTYASIADDNLNNLPTDPLYWYSLGSQWTVGFPLVAAWDAGITYHAVGSWQLFGNNQFGTMVGCYSEGDQAPGYTSQRNLLLGGDNGAGTRGVSAHLKAEASKIYSDGELWSGNPNATASSRAYLANDGLAFTMGSSAAGFKYNNTLKAVQLGATVSGGNQQYIWANGVTNAEQGRSVNVRAGSPGFVNGILFTTPTSRSTFHLLDSCKTFPTTSFLDWGDMFLVTASNYTHLKPENIFIKYHNSIATVNGTIDANTKLLTIKGYMEDILTAASGTFQLVKDYNIPTDRGILYNVQFVASDATNDCVINREVLVVNRGGTATVVNNTALRADYVPGTFATVAFDFNITGASVTVNLLNLPAGTNGKVNIKRIEY